MIITLTGTNEFMLAHELQHLKAEFIAEHGDFGFESYDGQELDPKQLPSLLQALPFLSSRRMVVLRQPSAQKTAQEGLEALLGTVSDSTELVLVEPKLDKRTSYYKTLKQQTDFRNYEPLDERALASWLVGQAKEQQGSLSQADALYLVRRVGANQLLLANELKKLLAYQPQVGRQSIDLLTEPTPQSSVFDLLDAALSGNKQKTVSLYQEQRQQKVEPMAIMGMLAWQLHILAVVKTAGERSAAAIASEAKLSPYVVGKTQTIARRCSLEQVRSWVRAAARLDIRLKSDPIDADEAVLNYLLRLSA